MTASSFARIVRHLERQGILFSDDHPKIVANVVRAFLRGRALRRAR